VKINTFKVAVWLFAVVAIIAAAKYFSSHPGEFKKIGIVPLIVIAIIIRFTVPSSFEDDD
jgi:hypothetical protein